jgi:DNA-binding transcriptional LysR family regulator
MSFLQRYPNLKLNVTLSENPINIIEEGFDLQIRIQIPNEENLQVEKLMTNRKAVIASANYVAKHGAPKDVNDLLNHNCIVFGENSTWGFKDKKTNKLTEMRDMKGNITCNNGEIIKELLMADVGITIKSVCDIEQDIADKKLIPLLTDYDVVNETEFYVVYPASKNISPKIKAFVEFFQEKLLLKKI